MEDDVELPILSTTTQTDDRHGYPAEGLKDKRTLDLLRLGAIAIYGLLIIALLAWACSGPVLSATNRVLRTGTIHVDQFYCGLALSAIFTPLALVIRNTASRMNKIHPFMIAREKQIMLADLDKLCEEGILGTATTASYSVEKGVIQGFLQLSGAILVPIATLMLTTGVFITSLPGTSVVGVPTSPFAQGGQVPLSIMMEGYMLKPTTFQAAVADLYVGNLLSSADMLSSSEEVLSNTPTANLSLTEGTWYYGIPTYNWNASCEAAPEIRYNATVGEGEILVTFISPNGTEETPVDVWEPVVFIWSYGVLYGSIIFANETTYYAVTGYTSALNENSKSGEGLFVGDDYWVSAVKCYSSMSYEVSQCQWNGTRMTNCTAMPGGDINTELDTVGLSQLGDYLNTLPIALYLQNTGFLNYTNIVETTLTYAFSSPSFPGGEDHEYRAPRIGDYINMYGLVASSMVELISNGYFGTISIPTRGETSNAVYVVRIPILVAVLCLVAGCIFAVTFDIIASRTRQSPVREISFLTIAAATRGRWWEDYMEGFCAAPRQVLWRRAKAKVTFGVDGEHPEHIGFGPETNEIIWRKRYKGTSMRGWR